MNVINPYTQEVIGEITLSDENEVEKLIDKAIEAKGKMRKLSSGEKAHILKEIIKGIEQKKETFTETIIQESGKPFKYAKAEVERAIQSFKFAAEEATRLPHELFDLDATEKGKHLRGELIYFPRGIVFGISPFNFPFNLAVHKIAPAIAAGCPILLKPSSKTPLTMELLKEVISTTKLPKGAFEIIHCSRETGNNIIAHPKIDVLSFTGSPGVGWKMKAMAKKKHTVLELGGNAAAIVAQDADLKLAVEELLVGGFAYSGQVCIHTQRIYTHKSIFEQFKTLYLKRVEQLKIGDPLDQATDFAIMIDLENAKRVEKWVKEATDNGAECLLGGERVNNFYTPTILTNVKKGLKVRDEEVFGPVVIIEPYATLNEAIHTVNDSRWGLQAALFTNDISKRNLAFNQLEVGALIHNKSTTFRVDNMPYGGIKDSGFGREGIKYTMKDYLEPKLLVRE
ncbi:aldehyde dehydrogenase family protein [Brumimicrobium salinarum]|nr:aldehyde dehydrogenase family protein [Brumimicrobium salinarum]